MSETGPGGEDRTGDFHLGDDVAALALGQVDGQRRALMASHLLTCSTCRREYDEVAATIEELLPIVPAVQPPIGFDERVLARLDAPSTSRRGARRRWIAAAAAAIVAVVALAGWWIATTSDGEPGDDVAALVLADGATVGTVSVGHVDDERVIVVAIVDAPADVSYTCRTTLADGTIVASEPWPAGAGAWLVPLPATGDVASVELVVSGTDNIWSTATFS